MSAIATGLDLGTLRVRTRLVPNGTISDIWIPVRQPRPQERLVDSLRHKLVASGVGRFENVRKVMKPFRTMFVLLRIKFRDGTARDSAHRATLMAVTGLGEAGKRKAAAEDSVGPNRTRLKETYIDRHYHIAHHRH